MTARLRHASSRLAAIASIAALGIGGCAGDEGLNADSTCEEVLTADPAEADAAINQATIDAGTEDAGNPNLIASVRSACGGQPDSTLGEVVNGFPAETGGGGVSGAPPADGGSASVSEGPAPEGDFEQYEELEAVAQEFFEKADYCSYCEYGPIQNAEVFEGRLQLEVDQGDWAKLEPVCDVIVERFEVDGLDAIDLVGGSYEERPIC